MDQSLADLPAYYFNPANSEFGAPLLTTVDILSAVPEVHYFTLGRTYLNVPGVMVPLAVWSDRPDAAGEWYAQTFYPEDWESGGGFAFSPVAEAYLNFGTAGVIGMFLLLGVLLGALGAHFQHHWPLAPIPAAAYALAVPWLITFFRHDAATVVKGYFLLTLIPLLLFWLLSRLLAMAAGRPGWWTTVAGPSRGLGPTLPTGHGR